MFDFLRGCGPAFDRAHARSLGAGDGTFEKLLVEHGILGSVVGIDLADGRVREANERSGELADRLRYEVADANRGDYGLASYDVLFAKAALHHIAELESMMQGMRRALRPGGRLVTLDFFGPNRFQWTDAQLAAVNGFCATRFHWHFAVVPMARRSNSCSARHRKRWRG
ncbi:MAG: class I SAM-dependent methyltransferase [Rubrivivax sp.]|nr:class I SAM-dependent methyltransferase [Rubrivivax sp.]